jgi:hypothetical protein
MPVVNPRWYSARFPYAKMPRKATTLAYFGVGRERSEI